MGHCGAGSPRIPHGASRQSIFHGPFQAHPRRKGSRHNPFGLARRARRRGRIPGYAAPRWLRRGPAPVRGGEASRQDRADGLSDGAGQDFASRFFAQTQSFSFDKQGRVGLTADLLEHAGIVKDTVLVGSLTKFNMYSPSRWQKVEARTSGENFGDIMRRLGI